MMNQPRGDDDTRSANSTRAIDEFFVQISHELRIPINAILGWAEVLSLQQFDEAMFIKAVEVIKRNARFQAKLIDELSDYSRFATHKLELKLSKVSLATIVRTAIETLTPIASQTLIRVEALLDSSETEMDGDPFRLQEVFLNLLSNSIKFTPPGGQIKVELKTIGNNSIVTVSDTGEGISPAFLPFIFDHYRREDPTARGQTGLGLGLAIVRSIVELHRGTVTAESPGKALGAVFTVRLPHRQQRKAAVT
jgi:signal transduction histidine kinase